MVLCKDPFEPQLDLELELEITKKAILVVSFGTSYPETLKLNIERVEDRIQAAYPDYDVRRAFTSRIVTKKLKERDGIIIDTERQALNRLKEQGFTEVIVQPLHIVAGEEYEKVKNVVLSYAKRRIFTRISLGRPLLYYLGQGDKPDDYMIALRALERQIPHCGSDDATVLMGHGGAHPANAGYAALQMKLLEAGLNDVYVYTVEGYPSLDDVISQLKKKGSKKVCLMPFMLVAGDHVVNDMAGNEKESAKSRLAAAGFQVNVCMRGLGENAAIQDVYVQHVKDALTDYL